MRHSSSSGPSQRQLRVGEQLRHIIAETMQRGHFRDPVMLDYAPEITVSEVQVSPDLKKATAYVLSLGGRNMDKILPALNDSASVFQKDISRKMNLKFTPRVHFMEDYSFAQGQKIDTILGSLPELKKTDEQGE